MSTTLLPRRGAPLLRMRPAEPGVWATVRRAPTGPGYRTAPSPEGLTTAGRHLRRRDAIRAAQHAASHPAKPVTAALPAPDRLAPFNGAMDFLLMWGPYHCLRYPNGTRVVTHALSSTDASMVWHWVYRSHRAAIRAVQHGVRYDQVPDAAGVHLEHDGAHTRAGRYHRLPPTPPPTHYHRRKLAP